MAQLCNAIARSTGERCKQIAVTGSTKCHYHGGKTPKGIASPHFKTGIRSKVMPVRLLEQFQESMNDPELLSLRSDIALLDARITDLIKRVDSGESGRIYQYMRAEYDSFTKAQIAARDAEEGSTEKRHYNSIAADALNELGRLIVRGQGDYAAWKELTDLLEQRRKAVESEQNRLIKAEGVIRLEDMMAVMTSLAFAVKEHVQDRDARAKITAVMERFLSPAYSDAAGNQDV